MLRVIVNGIPSVARIITFAPSVSGFARYYDSNMNSTCDAGDELVVPFTQDVTINGLDATHFSLPVTGDSLGTGATVAAGPNSNEITITLGTNPSLKTRQNYMAGDHDNNSPSGIDLATGIL